MIKSNKVVSAIFALILCTNAFDLSEDMDRYEILKTTSSEHSKLFCRYHIIEFEIEIKAIDDVNEKITSSISILKSICQKIHFNHICLFMMNEIKILSNSFNSKNKIIQNLQTYTRRRRTMNEFLSVLQKTVYITDNSYNNLKTGIEQMQSLTNMLRKTQNKFLDNLDYTNFYSLAQLIEMNLKNLLHITNAIIELFVNKNFQKIMDLVPIEILKKNFANINLTAQKENCKIPFNSNTLEIAKLLKIAKVSLIRNSQNFTIKIKIPTTYKNSYQIVKSIPLPFMYKNSTYEAQPIYENYLFFQENNDILYSIPFSTTEKIECTSIKNNLLMCNPKCAVQKTKIIPSQTFFLPEFQKCNKLNFEFFSDLPKQFRNCNLKQTYHANRIIPISNEEIFIYIVEPTFLKIVCPSEMVNRYINSSLFVLNLENQCSLYIDNGLIAEHSNKNTSIKKHRLNLFLSYSISTEDLIKKDPKNFNIKPIKELHSELNDLKNQVTTIQKNNTEVKKEKTAHDDIWVDILLIVAIYILVILCFIATNLYYKNKQKILNAWSGIRDTCLTTAANV